MHEFQAVLLTIDINKKQDMCISNQSCYGSICRPLGCFVCSTHLGLTNQCTVRHAISDSNGTSVDCGLHIQHVIDEHLLINAEV